MSVRGVAHFARKMRFKTTIGKSGFGCFLTIFWKPRASSEGQKAGQNRIKTPKSVSSGDSIGLRSQPTSVNPENHDKIKNFRG